MFKLIMLIFFVIFEFVFEFFSKFVDIVLVNETAQESEYSHMEAMANASRNPHHSRLRHGESRVDG